ncbi:MAG TPA: glycosyltransferase family 4 protein [Candidatus Eisenbacteria bacterium]|jgi:glycosyltransferase involved in cell wall biosynthesis|nr:glycosyltransferase family 4 protein [Candidatus Eisenbacteria bacterium]
MKLLFLTSRMPSPPVGGDRFRVFHILRTAAEAGHRIHLVTFDDGRSDARALEPLRRLAHRIDVVRLPRILSWYRAGWALPTGEPLQAAYYRSARMERAVAAAFDRAHPEVVYTHLFRMAPYALAEQRRRDARWILDLTDVISAGMARSLPYRSGPGRWLHREESRRIARYEARIAPCFDECWLISEAEVRALRALAPGATARVVPNGFEGDARVAPAGGDGRRERSRLLFFGFHDVFHNRDAVRFLVEEIVPRVRARIPEASLDIAGKGSDALGPWVRRPGVRVLGYVPDLEAELRRATLFVAPHRFAAGVQNKVLQALATGTPVVTTPIVRQGLEPIPDGILRIGSDAGEVAEQVVALLLDPGEAALLGARGSQWARGRFTWRTSLEAIEGGEAAGTTDEPLPAPARLAVAGA